MLTSTAARLERGDNLTIRSPHPYGGKHVTVTRVLDDGRICTNIGVVLRADQVDAADVKPTVADVAVDGFISMRDAVKAAFGRA